MEPTDRPLRGELLRRLNQTPEENRRQVLLHHIGLVVGDLLGDESLTEPTPDQRMFELGLGSLALVEFKNRIEVDLGVELPVTLFFKYATLGELGDHLLTGVLGLGGQRIAAMEQRPSPEPRPTPLEDRLEAMSEQEAEAELLLQITSLDEHSRS